MNWKKQIVYLGTKWILEEAEELIIGKHTAWIKNTKQNEKNQILLQSVMGGWDNYSSLSDVLEFNFKQLINNQVEFFIALVKDEPEFKELERLFVKKRIWERRTEIARRIKWINTRINELKKLYMNEKDEEFREKIKQEIIKLKDEKAELVREIKRIDKKVFKLIKRLGVKLGARLQEYRAFGETINARLQRWAQKKVRSTGDMRYYRIYYKALQNAIKYNIKMHTWYIIHKIIEALIAAYSSWLSSQHKKHKKLHIESDIDLLKELGWDMGDDKKLSAVEVIDRKKITKVNFDRVPFLRGVEIYAVADGLIVSDVPRGHVAAEFTLEELTAFIIDPEIRETLLKIEKYNPTLYHKKFYIIKPKFDYLGPEQVWYVEKDGKKIPVLAKFLDKYYYPKIWHIKDPESGKTYKKVHMKIPIERIFMEDRGKLEINCILHFIDGTSLKLHLVDIEVDFRGKHHEIPLSELKFLKTATKRYLEEYGDTLSEGYKKYLLDKLSKLGSRNSMLARIFVNDKPIESLLDRIAAWYSRKLGDPKKKQRKYRRKYRSSLILETRTFGGEYNRKFGNQRIKIIPIEYGKSLWKSCKKNRKILGLKFDRKEKVLFEDDAYYYILKWHNRPLNHMIYSFDPFRVYLLGFEKYNLYLIFPTKNGQVFFIINKHHGKEGLYNMRLRVSEKECIAFTHVDPDLSDSEKEEILAKDI